MSDVIDVLRDQYNAVMSQETDWGFFVSLAGFVDYILEMPALKKIADEAMSAKRKEYEKLAELENKTIKELEKAKVELLKVIKTNNIPKDSLISVWSSIPQGFTHGLNNILDRLEAFEKGDFSISGFKSDNLEHFLFDIASSLLKSGHQSLVKGFLVSNEEYGRYYNDSDSRFVITGNENGNFIFSNTLRLRREQSRLIENAKRYELWGVFDALLKLQIAYSEKSKNADFSELLQKYVSEAKNYQEAQDTVDVVFYAEDLAVISGVNSNSVFASHNIRYHLKKDDFKSHLSRVNTYLLKELAKNEIPQNPRELKSIYLITNSLEPQDVIFLVLDERFETPIRYEAKNSRGEPTYIKKLYDVAYSWNVPNKKVDYNRNIADGINNGLFRKRAVAKYMRTNKFQKPTLVQKSKEGTLVLQNDISVKTGLVKSIPSQHQSFYIDKTK